MSRAKAVPRVDLDLRLLEPMLQRVALVMSTEDVALIRLLSDTLVRVTALLRERSTTIARMRRLFGLTSSEKSRDLFPGTPAEPPAPEADGASAPDPSGPAPKESENTPPPEDKPKGHGRVPASDYGAAQHLPVPHAKLHVGDTCPECVRGKLYALREPSPIVRILGQPPLTATCWDLERLRCSGCGIIHTAKQPPEAQGPKFDDSAVAMLALLRYGAGMPFNRLDQLQRDLRLPVPRSTQWDVLKQRVELVEPAYKELERLAAQGKVLHNDDTTARILAFMGKRRAALVRAGKLPDPERTGLFTTAIVSITDVGPIAIFTTGRKHAGENLAALLEAREVELEPPVQMSDALSRNVPKGHSVIEANCLAHGRRQVGDERENHPEECRHLFEQLARVYQVDKECKLRQLSAQERLAEHQRVSGPIMEALRVWMASHLDDKRVEPNSALGQAFTYFLKRWEKFTVFLREPGAPLDNNIAERALKKFIRQRRASLFFRSEKGASVGDVFTTLLHTAELHGQNPFEYLRALLGHAEQVKAQPSAWMPWNYRGTVEGLRDRAAA